MKAQLSIDNFTYVDNDTAQHFKMAIQNTNFTGVTVGSLIKNAIFLIDHFGKGYE